MEFKEYQAQAIKTDRVPATGDDVQKGLIVPMLGLAGETGQLLSEYKKHLRDGPAHRLFKERVAEELGDLLWYVSNVASKFDLDLSEIAEKNLVKVQSRWSPENPNPPTFDGGMPAGERLPRRMLIKLTEIDGERGRRAQMSIDGQAIGSLLSDNAYDADGYRFHDVFHLSYAAVLGWSPNLRAFLQRKRKSEPLLDEVEDGGNHDVLQGTAPASSERYRPFIEVWRGAGCVTPWFDGIDPVGTTEQEKHRLVSPDKGWAIFPINSANWSQVDTILPAPLLDVWPDLHRLLEKDDPAKAKKVREQLDALGRADMARVSELQLEEFRRIVSSAPVGASGQIKIAALHHHLSAPSLREEVKAFADFTNLQLLRQALRSSKIDVVLHGHKHEHVARFDAIYDVDGLTGERPHRTLVLSGATFTDAQDKDAARILSLEGLPFIPVLETQAVPVPRGGVELKLQQPQRFRLWRSPHLTGGPVVIQGRDFDVVYHQACAAAVEDAPKGTLIVHLELDASAPVRLPVDYPLPPGMSEKERDTWFGELVRWWQLGVSALDHRVPYLHGIRLHRFAGSIDQIQRVRALLKAKETSRAVATLIDPVRDFDPKGQDEDFASFCLVQFRRRGPDDGGQVDVIGYYRAQEFARWWPINVAELRSLQISVVKGTKLVPGKITTVTAEARSIGRSPTQVAMPVIDRWLDQHPERLHVLANCFLGKGPGGEVENVVRRQWTQMLDDLEAATLEFNPDGVPVPIDGLATLLSYMSADGPKGEAGALLKKIGELNKENTRFSSSPQSYEDWEAWGARDILADLRMLSSSLLGADKS